MIPLVARDAQGNEIAGRPVPIAAISPSIHLPDVLCSGPDKIAGRCVARLFGKLSGDSANTIALIDGSQASSLAESPRQCLCSALATRRVPHRCPFGTTLPAGNVTLARPNLACRSEPLDAEDRFERIEKGETSATNPGPESGTIAGKDRGPLHGGRDADRSMGEP